MLQANIPWLADGYRVKLQEKDRTRLENVHGRDENKSPFHLQDSSSLASGVDDHVLSCEPSVVSKTTGDSVTAGLSQACGCGVQSYSGGQGNNVSRTSDEDDVEGLRSIVEHFCEELREDGLEEEEKENMSWLRTLNHSRVPRPGGARTKNGRSRPRSAMPGTITLGRGGYRLRRGSQKPRPASAFVTSGLASALPGSANSGTVAPRHQRVGAARQAWVEDASKGLHIAGANSGSLFLDRHVRCLNGTQAHEVPWADFHSPRAGLETPPVRPGSPASLDGVVLQQPPPQTPIDRLSGLQRYTACHRPQTAPTTRQEWSNFSRQNRKLVGKGRSHFCNFVHQASLHPRLVEDFSRPLSAAAGHYGSRNKLSEFPDKDFVAQWKNNSRLYRGQSGTQGRPGSPSSADDEHTRGEFASPGGTKGGRQDTQIGGDLDLVSKMIPKVNIPSTSNAQLDSPASTLRTNVEDARKKSSKDETASKASASMKNKPSKLPASSSASSNQPSPNSPEEASKGQRLSVSRKEKKCASRHRNRKETEVEGAQAQQNISGDVAEAGNSALGSGEQFPDVNGMVPDLPQVRPRNKDKGRSPSNKGERRLMPPPSEGRKLLPHELFEQSLPLASVFDFGDMQNTAEDSSKKKRTSWMNDRMALSQQSSRFELPMDMKDLEKMTPQEYLQKYCIVTSRRLNLYQKVFMKHKDRTNNLNREGLKLCLKEVLIEMLRENTLGDLFELVNITEETTIDFKLFSGIAALGERLLYPYYTTLDTAEKSEYQRAVIETADFGALSWKLCGLNVTGVMRKLLETLNSCSAMKVEK